MKPIEPGCLAIIVKSRFPENIGREVTVVRAIPELYAWEVEAPDPLTGQYLYDPVPHDTLSVTAFPDQLLRIDGGEDLQAINVTKKEEPA